VGRWVSIHLFHVVSHNVARHSSAKVVYLKNKKVSMIYAYSSNTPEAQALLDVLLLAK